MGVRRLAVTIDEWAQHFSNASCWISMCTGCSYIITRANAAAYFWQPNQARFASLSLSLHLGISLFASRWNLFASSFCWSLLTVLLWSVISFMVQQFVVLNANLSCFVAFKVKLLLSVSLCLLVYVSCESSINSHRCVCVSIWYAKFSNTTNRSLHCNSRMHPPKKKINDFVTCDLHKARSDLMNCFEEIVTEARGHHHHHGHF